MKRLLTLLLVAFFLWPVAANSITQYKTSNSASEGLSLTLDDPIGSIYQEGEEVGFTIRTDRDAYVVVFNIDTEGFVHLLYPQDRKNLRKFSANRIHYIPEDREQTLVVGGTTGIEFVFAVAVENRDYINEEEIGFLAANDITPDSNNFQIDGDPLLAANRVASQLVRGISHRRGVTMSYTYFYINEAVDFPRYLCEECYTNGKDPYGPGMPNYVAYADFENTDRLTYPLEQGFVREGNDNLGLNPQLGNTSVTTAYISYYPRWDDGFYSTAWWYNDPWYWGTPYNGSSFYFSVGWNWGWGNCHYRYFPYYYNGPYYACGPNWGYYDCYPTQFYYPTHYDNAYNKRSFRPTPKGGGSGLHTAMNQTSTRDLRARQRSLKSSYAKDGLRRTGGRTDLARTFKGTRDARTYTGKDPLVIRSRPLKGQDRSTRKSLARSSKKVSPRDRRVITSSQTRRATARGSKGSVNTQGIRRTSSSMSRKIGQTGTYRGNVPKSGTRSKSSTSRTYKPNTRKSSGSSVRSKSGSGTRSNYKAPASRSSSGGKSSARSSGRSSGSRSSSRSSGGKSRK
jgi:hypothetical protein